VLVTAEGDWAAPARHRHRLADPRIIRWFGQNCDLEVPHRKFETIPLGFAEPHWPHGNQAAMMRVHRRMPIVLEKPVQALASFHLTLSHPERAEVWRTLEGVPEIAFEARRIPPELLWIRHVNYAFEVCPRGAGRDTHRVWEALLLRTIPIVERSTLDPLYREFPVAFVSDWREITVEAMDGWRMHLADRFDPAMFERLTANYWLSRIRETTAQASAPHQGDSVGAARP